MAEPKATTRRRSTSGRSTAPTRRAGPVPGAADAAEAAVHQDQHGVRLPVVGQVALPPTEHLAWYGGVVALAALSVLDWPVALVLAAGKALADNRSHETLRAFGEALETAE